MRIITIKTLRLLRYILNGTPDIRIAAIIDTVITARDTKLNVQNKITIYAIRSRIFTRGSIR
jgi:hypothetical protein